MPERVVEGFARAYGGRVVAPKRYEDIGVVVAGAGARGAYEAGLLAHMLPEVAGRVQASGRVARFSFLGTSAGALNSALIASRAPHVLPGDGVGAVRRRWTDAMAEVTEVWETITEPKVVDLRPEGRLLAAATRLVPFLHAPWTSVLNVGPLEALARDPRVVDWATLRHNVEAGVVAVVGAATTARDGRTVVFLDRPGNPDPLPRDVDRDIDYVDVPAGLSAEHVLASAAIPSLFPAVRITSPEQWAGWYYDGGVRLNTPIKPALELGLDKLIIVGTHPDRYDRQALPDPDLPRPEVDEAVLPVANQVMVDQLIQDLVTLRRRNAQDAGRVVEHLFAGPESLDTLAGLSKDSPTRFGVNRLLRGALSEKAKWELSSYLLFDPGFLAESIHAGRRRSMHLLPPGNDPVPWQV